MPNHENVVRITVTYDTEITPSALDAIAAFIAHGEGVQRVTARRSGTPMTQAAIAGKSSNKGVVTLRADSRRFVYEGWVASRGDRDAHFIHFNELCALWGLYPQECIAIDHGQTLAEAGYEERPGDQHYHVMQDGAYPPAF